MKTALSIAGSDCSGGAGVQADIKTMSAIGVYGMSVIVSVVAENTSRVIRAEDVSPEMIACQIDAVFEDIKVDAVKVGMLTTPRCMEVVAERLARYAPPHVVLDPVMYAKDGTALMHEDAVDTYIRKLIPIATLVTPNIPEAERLSGIKIGDERDVAEAAKVIRGMGARSVLVKGGHSDGDPVDFLFDGTERKFSAARIATENTHGTGCTLSSAIAAYLALGLPISEAVAQAKEYITGAIANSLDIGKGHGPLGHFYKFYGERK